MNTTNLIQLARAKKKECLRRLHKTDRSIIVNLLRTIAATACSAIDAHYFQRDFSPKQPHIIISIIRPTYRQSGFTLIEVLISVIIMAIGLLGLASLQGIALKNNQDAYLFSQANMLATEMSDRILANKSYWSIAANVPPPTVTSCTPACNSAATRCTATEIATCDYSQWQQNAKTLLSPTATAVIAQSPVAGSTICTGTAPTLTLCLTMTWSRTNQQLGSTMSQTKFQLEVSPN